jgi:hypothetical protein
VSRDRTQGFAVIKLEAPVSGTAKRVRLFQYCVEHRREIAERAIDDLEDFGRGRLLVASLAQFGGQPRDRLVGCLGGRARRRRKQIHRCARWCGTRQTNPFAYRRRVARRPSCIICIAALVFNRHTDRSRSQPATFLRVPAGRAVRLRLEFA